MRQLQLALYALFCALNATVLKQAPHSAKSRPLQVAPPMIMPGTRLDTNFNSLPAYNPDVAKAAPNWLKKQATGNPSYIIDGKMATANQLRQLQPNQVASVNRLSASKAVALYGKNARNGLVLITTKAGLTPKN